MSRIAEQAVTAVSETHTRHGARYVSDEAEERILVDNGKYSPCSCQKPQMAFTPRHRIVVCAKCERRWNIFQPWG